MSVFSFKASRETKLRYAFRIYDYDGDGKIGKDDLQQTLSVITGDKMEPEFMLAVVDQVRLASCRMRECVRAR
jgi:serine/threonine-protein phosphatase 2B regulatory subunit